MAHTREPGEAHQAYMRHLDEADKRFAASLPPAERLAIAAQFVGQLIGEMPDHYDKREIMQVVAGNMEAGNQQATGGTGSSLDPGKLLQIPK
ncbi:MAG: hypothetical protein KDA41_22405 [Planctomycetales bacterium]|nr:hypothetical protein [Planctomycetales bacterium]